MTIVACTSSAGVDVKDPATPSLTGRKIDDSPKVDSNSLPEVDWRERSYPETAYSSIPEVVEFPHDPESRGSSKPSSLAQTAPSTSHAVASSSSARHPSPTSSVYLASLLRGPTLLSSAALLQDDNGTACSSAVPYAAPGRAPCDQAFELSAGFAYRWRGCGQLPTYVAWAVGGEADETRLGVCGDVPPAARWDCGAGQTLAAEWLCGPATM
ncbi:hypothetical protein ACHAP6_008449 [Verticillium nonalfalfae]